jgi:hypothetical protein
MQQPTPYLITIDARVYEQHLQFLVKRAQTRAIKRKNAKGWSAKMMCPLEIAVYLFGRCAWTPDVPHTDELDCSFKNARILDPILGEGWDQVENYIDGIKDGYLGLHAEAFRPICLFYDETRNILSLYCRVLYYNTFGVPQFGLQATKQKKRRLEAESSSSRKEALSELASLLEKKNNQGSENM